MSSQQEDGQGTITLHFAAEDLAVAGVLTGASTLVRTHNPPEVLPVVRGCLSHFTHYWTELKQDGLVLSAMTEGSQIEFSSSVPLHQSVAETKRLAM